PSTTVTSTLSLHDALPICDPRARRERRLARPAGGADEEKPRRHDRAKSAGRRKSIDPRHAAAAELRAGLHAGVRSRLRRAGKALPDRAGAVLSGGRRPKARFVPARPHPPERRGAAAHPGTRLDEAAAAAQVTVSRAGPTLRRPMVLASKPCFLKISSTWASEEVATSNPPLVCGSVRSFFFQSGNPAGSWTSWP